MKLDLKSNLSTFVLDMQVGKPNYKGQTRFSNPQY